MILCLCANISDKEIKQMLEEGKNLKEIMDETGLCSGCFTCKNDLIEILKIVGKEKDYAECSVE